MLIIFFNAEILEKSESMKNIFRFPNSDMDNNFSKRSLKKFDLSYVTVM